MYLMHLLWSRQSRYNTDKENLERKMCEVGSNIPNVSDLVTTAPLITKIGEGEYKFPYVSSFARKTDYNAKILDTEKNTLLLLILINLWVTYLMQIWKKKN